MKTLDWFIDESRLPKNHNSREQNKNKKKPTTVRVASVVGSERRTRVLYNLGGRAQMYIN